MTLWSFGHASRSQEELNQLTPGLDKATSALCVLCKTEDSCSQRGLTCLECPICQSFMSTITEEAKSSGCPSSCNKNLCAPLKEICGDRCPKLCARDRKKKSKKKVWKPVKDLLVELESLVGLGDVKDQMKEIIAQVDFNLQRANLKLPDIGGQSLHMAFLGNPGTGKTVVARIVGELLVAMGAIRSNATESEDRDLVSEVSRPDLVGEHSGATALKVTKAFDDADGGVLFIDEAYSIVQGDSDSFGREAVDTIIKLMEDRRDRIIVILAGYQKEMSDFVAANPGFKSRIAFSFNFPDYTCPQLVKIADRLMKKKNVALTSDGSTCESENPPDSCPWLKNAIRLQTGCCETKDCGKQENRANGNGRTVRNILEASYRKMSSRVLTSFTPQLLQEYDSRFKPKVIGEGDKEEPSPPLSCAGFDPLRDQGPFTSIKETKKADVRCAFYLLESSDVRLSTTAALDEKLRSVCQATKTPVTVNVNELRADRFKWDDLHQKLYHEEDCQEVQASLTGSSSFLQDTVDVTGCEACTGHYICKMRPSICRGCPKCNEFLAPDGSGDEDSENKCKVCAWVKQRYQNRPRGEIPLSYEDKEVCSAFEKRHPGDSGKWCRYIVGKALRALRSQEPWNCADVLQLKCVEAEQFESGMGGIAMLRPGSKVDNLMKELQELVGLASVKAGISALRDTVEFDMWRRRFLGEHWSLLGQNFHMRFLGNPGTGKTVVARIVGKILVELGVVKKPENPDLEDGFVFREVSRADLVGSYVGHTAPKVQKAVKSAFGGVLFIDEAYSLIQGERDSFGQEAVDTLIKEIEDHRDKVIVILAGYHKEMDTFFKSNPGFQSRVPFRFDFADYSCEELSEMSGMTLKKQNITPTVEAESWISKMVGEKTGCCSEAQLEGGTCSGATRDNGNGRAVRNILESALRAMSVRAVFSSQSSPVSKKMVTELVASDVAFVGGELLGERVRSTCKLAGQAVPDLELLTGPRVLALDFDKAMSRAKRSCSKTTRMILEAKPTSSLGSAADIEIKEKELKKVFAELDELIGLASVKRAMREFYATVEFANLRKKAGLQPLKSQSFHMRFLGNPGTGKTVVARIVGKLLVALGAIEKPADTDDTADTADTNATVFHEVSRSDLVAEYVGQTATKVLDAVKKSLGGVLFLDEAYALIQGSRDTFGQEAVDTLIKEMEDKRANFIVICAGYEKEMDDFFQSNPGFKSRVPFTFHFEDYTCPELYDIGKLGLNKKELKLPSDLSTYQDALSFSTGCCERLEECTPDRAKGNGRAVRNAIEAAVRAMAKRVQGSEASVKTYTELKVEDFAVVTSQAVQQHLSVKCGQSGDLATIREFMLNASLSESYQFYYDIRRKIKSTPDKAQQLAARLTSVLSETNAVNSMRGLDERSAKVGQTCKQQLNEMKKDTMKSLVQLCRSSTLDMLAEKVQTGTSEGQVEAALTYLEAIMGGVEVMSELLQCYGEHKAITQVRKLCSLKLEQIRSMDFRMPFSLNDK